jgi:RimJ/RimL family protein N-acetyltransferase
LRRILAIVQADNERSITLLSGLGFEFVNITTSPTDATETLHLYASDV